MSAVPKIVNQAPSLWLEVHPKLGISMMDHLFNRLDGAYPNRWRAQFQTEQAINNWREAWVEAFEDASLTIEEVKEGLRACRTKFDWPPSCAEFIKACRPPIDPMIAYYEAINGMAARDCGEKGEWSHPAIFWAAARIGAFDLKNQSYSQIKTRWENALKDVLNAGTYADIPDPQKMLPAPGKAVLSRESEARMLQELKENSVNKQNDCQIDHKRWAKKLLDKEKSGGVKLTELQFRFANDALRSRHEN